MNLNCLPLASQSATSIPHFIVPEVKLSQDRRAYLFQKGMSQGCLSEPHSRAKAACRKPTLPSEVSLPRLSPSFSHYRLGPQHCLFLQRQLRRS